MPLTLSVEMAQMRMVLYQTDLQTRRYLWHPLQISWYVPSRILILSTPRRFYRRIMPRYSVILVVTTMLRVISTVSPSPFTLEASISSTLISSLSYLYEVFLCFYAIDGDNDVLQTAWQVVKGSTIPDAKKNDLSQLLLQTLMERGCPLVIMRRVEKCCDLLVKESVAALVALDAAAATAEEAEQNGEARKMQKAADGSRVVSGGTSSSWNF
jgi:hypothetical protein